MRSNKDWTEIDLEALPEDFIPRTSLQQIIQPDTATQAFNRDYTHWEQPNEELISSRKFYRLAWRSMAARTGERTLHATLLPPDLTHVHAVRTGAIVGRNFDNRRLIILAALLSSLPVDFQVKTSVGSEISSTFIEQLPYMKS